MKDAPKGMRAFDDLDTLPGKRMRWEEWYKTWVREIESDEPDDDTPVPGEDEEDDGTEMPTALPDDAWADQASRTGA